MEHTTETSPLRSGLAKGAKLTGIGALVTLLLLGAGAVLGTCLGIKPGEPTRLETMRGAGDETWDKPGVIEKTGEMLDSLDAGQDGTRAFEEAP